MNTIRAVKLIRFCLLAQGFVARGVDTMQSYWCPCITPGCSRLARGGHTHCCSWCKHSCASSHKCSCTTRQAAAATADGDAFASSAPGPTGRATAGRSASDSRAWSAPRSSGAGGQSAGQPSSVELLRALLAENVGRMPPEDVKSWLRCLLRAFHADRHPNLPSSHACTQVLTDEFRRWR